MNVAVVGGGVFGLAAALTLRQRGHHVTVFEQGRVPYVRASSTDVSRTIRRLYGTQEIYVDLVEQSARQWKEWETLVNDRFFHQTGQLYITRHFAPGTRIFDGWKLLTVRGADVRVLTPAEARRRFPQFVYEPADVVVYDGWAGYLAADRAMATLARLVRAAGADLREHTLVTRVDESARSAFVVTGAEVLAFDRIVVAAGVWLGRLLPEIGRWLQVTLQEMAFFAPADPSLFEPGRMPVWGIDPDTEGWYGHPLLPEGFVKVAMHRPGATVDPDAERAATPAFVEAARAFVARRIPGLAQGRLVGSRACLYDNTPDRHFIIDWAPGRQRILVAGGGSGHGFKFGGVIGEVIADALEDRPNPLGSRFRIGKRFDRSLGRPD